MIASVFLREDFLEEKSGYPFDLDNLKSIVKNPLVFNSKVVFFVGDNGSGKTTLIEGMAVGLGASRYGGSKNFIDDSGKAILDDYLVISKRGFVRDVFFFRAETFFNLNEEVKRYGLYGKSDHLVKRYTGCERSFRELSHGQGFLRFFENRIGEDGTYLFDEPEAALSPSSQIDFLYKLREFENNGNQIFICTHSPILLAYPGAQIFSFDGDEIKEISYEDTPQFNVTKDFLDSYGIWQKSIERV